MEGRVSLQGRGSTDHATVYFRGRPLLRLFDKDGQPGIRLRSVPAMNALNELWKAKGPYDVRVTGSDDRPAITVNGRLIVEVLPLDEAAVEARVTAERWKAAIEGALATSTPSDGGGSGGPR
jgi:hypothetical protein